MPSSASLTCLAPVCHLSYRSRNESEAAPFQSASTNALTCDSIEESCCSTESEPVLSWPDTLRSCSEVTLIADTLTPLSFAVVGFGPARSGRLAASMGCTVGGCRSEHKEVSGWHQWGELPTSDREHSGVGAPQKAR